MATNGFLEELTCPVCHELYTEPKTLNPCMHTFCKVCLEGAVTKKDVKVQISAFPCPTCREPNDLSKGIQSIRTNFKLANMIESLQNYCAKCNQTRKKIAISYCEQCQIHLCDLCTLYHENSCDYTNHTVIRRISATVTPPVTPPAVPTPTVPKCPKHGDQSLVLYCVSCQVVMCTVCAFLSHKECSSSEYLNKDFIRKETESFGKEIEQLQQTLAKIDGHCERLNDMKTVIDEEQTQVLSKVNKATIEMKECVETSGQTLRDKVNAVYGKKLSPLNTQLACLDKIRDRINSVVREDINSLPWVQLLMRKKQLLEDVESIQKDSQQALEFKVSETSETCVEFRPSNTTPSVGHLIENIASYSCDVPSAIEQGKEHKLVLQSKNKDGTDIKYGGAAINPRISHAHDPSSFLPSEVLECGSGAYELRYTPAYHTPLKIRLSPNYEINLPVTRDYQPVVPIPSEYPVTSAPYGVCLLPNNQIAVSLNEKVVKIIDLADGHVIHTIATNFVRPYMMTVDKQSLWITDRDGHNIHRYSIEDNFRKTLQYGTRGTLPGYFQHPRGIAVHPVTGRLYITDMRNHRVQVLKVTETGGLEPAGSFGKEGKGECQFDQPASLLFNQHNQVVVSDDRNCRLQVLTDDGRYVASYGLTKGQRGILCSPIGLAQDNYGRYVVGEFGSHLVTVLDSDGKMLTCVRSVGGAVGSLSHPRGVTVDMDNYIYVADFGNQRIVRF